MRGRILVLLGLVHAALGSIALTKKDEIISNDVKTTTKVTTYITNVTQIAKMKEALNEININRLKTRRKSADDRSTSSSSGDKGSKKGSKSSKGGSSLEASSDSSSEAKSKENKYLKYHNFDVRGWRRWHRKCAPCPEDMVLKWKDPSIKWICGGYQRARRSFKSKCMMHYRNCQDGTMFVKIHDHRCANTSQYRGQHFFYDYKVALPDDSSGSKTSSSSSEQESSSSESF